MNQIYFLIAILGISTLTAGLSFAMIDWLLYSVLFKKLDEQLRFSLSCVFSLTTGLCVFFIVLTNLFIRAH